MIKRRILSFIILSLLLLPLLTLTAFAQEDEITVSEDFLSLEYQGKKYNYINYSATDVWFSNLEYHSIDVTILGNDDMEISTHVYVSEAIINIDFSFDEAYVPICYLAESAEAEYFDFLQHGSGNYNTHTRYGENVYFSSADIKGEPCNIKPAEYISHYSIPVTAMSDNEVFEKSVGEYIIDSLGTVYYIEYAENGADSESFSPLDYTEIAGWIVTDTVLIESLSKDRTLFNDDTTDIFVVIACVLCAIIFGMIPLVTLVISAVLISRSEGYYKRLLLSIIVISVLSLVAFAVMAFILFAVI